MPRSQELITGPKWRYIQPKLVVSHKCKKHVLSPRSSVELVPSLFGYSGDIGYSRFTVKVLVKASLRTDLLSKGKKEWMSSSLAKENVPWYMPVSGLTHYHHNISVMTAG
ncbi:hypothetical protein ACROYT_G044087 [Oculina patagonica]